MACCLFVLSLQPEYSSVTGLMYSTGLSAVLIMSCCTSFINGCRTGGPSYDMDPVKSIHEDQKWMRHSFTHQLNS